jgi:acyl-CoA thioester hydrolase
MDLQSLPVTHTAVIPKEYLDEMGHMNVMWYTHLFGRSTVALFERVGLNRAYFEANHTGTFALEQHIRFLAEVRVGQHITLRTRLLGRSAKRFHFMHFMFNDDRELLAATGEFVGAHIDLKVRKMSAVPENIAANFGRLLAEHSQLSWPAPVCGAMRP